MPSLLKAYLYTLLLLFNFFLSVREAYSQNISNEGTEFWVCFPAHVPSGGSLATMSVFITSKSNSSGKVWEIGWRHK